MAKRFVDTELWDKKWFMNLPPKLKCLAKYVRDKCDIAGIWCPNYVLASVYIGEQITEEELVGIDDGRQFQKVDDKILCIGFIDFQYGNTLNAHSPVHKKVMDILDKYNIEYISKETPQRLSFATPSLAQVYEEMCSKTDEYNAQIQSERFHSYYESNGWMVGKNKMKNWKSAAAGWLNRSRPEKRQVSAEDIKKSIKQIANRKLSEL